MKREECSKCGRDARVVREDYVWEDDFPVTLRNVELRWLLSANLTACVARKCVS